MKASFVLPVVVFSTIVLVCAKEQTKMIRCFVCENCADSFSSSDLKNCTTRGVTKCMKVELMSGEVDRMCADKTRCNGRGNGRHKREVLEEPVEDLLPKSRIVRQLLAGGDNGGNSNANKNKNDKNKDKQKEEKPGQKDAKEIHCCAEDECNGAVPLASSPPYSTFFLLSLIILLTSSFTFSEAPLSAMLS